MSKTKIEWADSVWNVVSGCSRKSAGCENCYAEVMTKRLALMGQEKYQGLLNAQNRFNGVLKLDEKALTKPLENKTPTKYFVNSMSDLFHENMPDEWIDKVFAIMALCPHHIFQILTKRPGKMRDYIAKRNEEWTDLGVSETLKNWEVHYENYELLHTDGKLKPHLQKAEWFWESFPTGEGGTDPGDLYYYGKIPLRNVWFGVSCENPSVKSRIRVLQDIPAAVRFLSLEPLLEDLGEINLTNIDWVIAGGESGNYARPVHPAWVRSIRDQCTAAGVPFFFKQWGSWKPIDQMSDEESDKCYFPLRKTQSPEDIRKPRFETTILHLDGKQDFSFPAGAMQVFRIGKKKAGNLLDGIKWEQFPKPEVVNV